MHACITPNFIKEYGSFTNTVIIMMESEGLNNTSMAEAFVGKGAEVCIGWNGSVSSAYSDQATTHLLEHLITEKQTIEQGVRETMDDVGQDPVNGSTLLFYPVEAADYVVPEFPTFLILPLFMIATLLGVIAYRRKHSM